MYEILGERCWLHNVGRFCVHGWDAKIALDRRGCFEQAKECVLSYIAKKSQVQWSLDSLAHSESFGKRSGAYKAARLTAIYPLYTRSYADEHTSLKVAGFEQLPNRENVIEAATAHLCSLT